MVVYKLTVAYNGANYHGFQRQVDNATVREQRKSSSSSSAHRSKRQRRHPSLTIQHVLENVLLDLYPTLDVTDLRVRCAGRTDKGVHARGQAVAVQLPDTTSSSTHDNDDDDDEDPRWVLHRALQSRLPRDISVHSVTPVAATFCPRHDVVQKEYSYTIKYCCQPPSSSSNPLPAVVMGTPLLRDALDPVDQCWYCPWPLVPKEPQFVCQDLCGTHNYRNFCHSSVQNEEDDHRLTIDSFTYEITHQRSEPLALVRQGSQGGGGGDRLVIVTGIFRVRGRKFHRAMVRKLVGYCVDQARGVETVPSVAAALDGSQLVAIAAAPASGLCLEYVQYV